MKTQTKDEFQVKGEDDEMNEFLVELKKDISYKNKLEEYGKLSIASKALNVWLLETKSSIEEIKRLDCVLSVEENRNGKLDERRSLPTVDLSNWILVSVELPKCEHEVDVTIKRIVNYDNEDHEFIFTCRAFYEDGEMWSEDSDYYWEYEYEYDSIYDEERDDFKVPKGWYEPTRFSETFARIDDDCVILAWKPVQEPYKDSSDK